jgi:hypothetical protein
MPVTPSGSFAVPQYLLRRMIAMSPTFQAARGVDNWTDALAGVKLKDVDPTLTNRPLVCVFTESLHWRLIAGGAQNVLRPDGTLFMWVVQDVDPADYEDTETAAIKFGNFLELIDDVAALAGADQTLDSSFPDSHLPINSISLIAQNESARELWKTECGRFYWAAFAVQWGDEE